MSKRNERGSLEVTLVHLESEGTSGLASTHSSALHVSGGNLVDCVWVGLQQYQVVTKLGISFYLSMEATSLSYGLRLSNLMPNPLHVMFPLSAMGT